MHPKLYEIIALLIALAPIILDPGSKFIDLLNLDFVELTKLF